MGIMTRLTRLFKADIHGVMDQIENKELVLKQCLREMESSLLEKQEKLKGSNASLERIEQISRQLNREKGKIEQDLRIAIEKGKDDIARLLIKKRIKTEQQIANAGRQAESVEKQIAMLSENIEAQKHQLAEMQIRSESWLQKAEHQEWEKYASNFAADNDWQMIPDEEVELELLKYKDAVKGGISND